MYLSNRNENTHLQKTLHNHFPRIFIYNSQTPKQTKFPSVGEWVNEYYSTVEQREPLIIYNSKNAKQIKTRLKLLHGMLYLQEV